MIRQAVRHIEWAVLGLSLVAGHRPVCRYDLTGIDGVCPECGGAATMKRRRRVQRIVMWTAWVVLGLSVAAWIASLWGPAWGSWPLSIQLIWGNVYVLHNNLPTTGDTGFSAEGFAWDQLWWFDPAGAWGWVVLLDGPPFGMVNAPLWMPLVLSGATIALLVWSNKRARGAEGEECESCGYDLTGIDGVCPECGRTPC